MTSINNNENNPKSQKFPIFLAFALAIVPVAKVSAKQLDITSAYDNSVIVAGRDNSNKRIPTYPIENNNIRVFALPAKREKIIFDNTNIDIDKNDDLRNYPNPKTHLHRTSYKSSPLTI